MLTDSAIAALVELVLLHPGGGSLATSVSMPAGFPTHSAVSPSSSFPCGCLTRTNWRQHRVEFGLHRVESSLDDVDCALQIQMKKALRETAEQKKFAPPQTPFPGVQDRQNLISWRWSLPSPTCPVW